MTMTPDEGRRQGEARRDDGMDRAAARREWQTKHDELALLDAIMRRPDRTATTDDATADLSRQYEDGGRWRGSIPKRLAAHGLIEQAGAIRSSRPSRHAGLLTQWRAADENGIERKRAELRQWLGQNPRPERERDHEQPDLFPDANKHEPGDGTRWART